MYDRVAAELRRAGIIRIDPGNTVLDGHAGRGELDRLHGYFHPCARMLLEKLGILRFDGRPAFVDRAAIIGRAAVGGPKGGHSPGVAAIEGLHEGHGVGANLAFRRCRPRRRRRLFLGRNEVLDGIRPDGAGGVFLARKEALIRTPRRKRPSGPAARLPPRGPSPRMTRSNVALLGMIMGCSWMVGGLTTLRHGGGSAGRKSRNPRASLTRWPCCSAAPLRVS